MRKEKGTILEMTAQITSLKGKVSNIGWLVTLARWQCYLLPPNFRNHVIEKNNF